MNAKEKQKKLIADYLKPMFKEAGYKTSGQTWWKINGDFFNVINLQNFSWNSAHRVDFTLNFSTGLTSKLKNCKKITIHDGFTNIRESFFFEKVTTKYRDSMGYHIDDFTDINDFTKKLSEDFKKILPKLDLLNSPESVLNFYTDDFWNPRVSNALKEAGFEK